MLLDAIASPDDPGVLAVAELPFEPPVVDAPPVAWSELHPPASIAIRAMVTPTVAGITEKRREAEAGVLRRVIAGGGWWWGAGRCPG